LPHDHAEYQQQMSHVWMGFGERQMGRYLSGAGLEQIRYRPLPADPSARGPALFAATAAKPAPGARAAKRTAKTTTRRSRQS
jgi:hypothetical protein